MVVYLYKSRNIIVAEFCGNGWRVVRSRLCAFSKCCSQSYWNYYVVMDVMSEHVWSKLRVCWSWIRMVGCVAIKSLSGLHNWVTRVSWGALMGERYKLVEC